MAYGSRVDFVYLVIYFHYQIIDREPDAMDLMALSVCQIGTSRRDGMITATVAGMPCEFLIDSGAQVNTFTESNFNRIMNDGRYKGEVLNVKTGSDRPLKAYATSKEIPVSATFEANLFITDDRPMYMEKFYVVNETRALLSRSTATRYSVLLLGLNVPVSTVHLDQSTINGREIASVVSSEPFPKFNVPPVKIYYDTSKPPCRNVYLNIPQAVKPLVEERLQQLISAEIIERVTDDMDTAFCSSLVIVPKGKEDIRLVIDLRGPNRYIHRSPFAMPTLESIVAELDGAKWFSTIDLTNAFFHIELDKDSRHLTNFFTEFGMFRCVRLPFGLCNAPDLFQEIMQRKVLGGCKGQINYLDDVMVFGATKEEHDANLAAVLACLENNNVKLNKSKCVFGSQSVKFIGFLFTSDGWKVQEEKMDAIQNFRTPTTCAEVKSFLGLITYVDRFIPNRADRTQHLRALANDSRFVWTNLEESEFQRLKNEALQTIKRLGYYNPKDRIELFVDASPIGLGAVLVQFNTSNIPRIIACASKALTPTEQRYPQTQKEALAVVWGVERFSSYLLSKSFTIRTDAEANEYIFSGSHRLGRRAASRAESWALRLQSYDYRIERVSGSENVADALSRLVEVTQDAAPFDEDDESHFLYTLDVGNMEITWSDIEKCSETDGELELVREALQNDVWPDCLRKYEAQKKNLHYLGAMVFKDDRSVLPLSLRMNAMRAAHSGHAGEVAMKRIMRDFFWWPGMSAEVERFVKGCETCVLLSKKNPPLPLSSRTLPNGPWEILQIDFLSLPNFGSGEFLIVTDTYSRHITVTEMESISAKHTNAALCNVFKIWGCPLVLQVRF